MNNVSVETNPVQQISAGNSHWAAWTTPPVSGPGGFHLGVPSKIPLKYTKLSGQSLPGLRRRLFTLKQVTSLVESTWRCFSYSSPNDATTGRGEKCLSSDTVRQMLESRLSLLPMAQILQRTMVQGRNYGPHVLVNRYHVPCVLRNFWINFFLKKASSPQTTPVITSQKLREEIEREDWPVPGQRVIKDLAQRSRSQHFCPNRHSDRHA